MPNKKAIIELVNSLNKATETHVIKEAIREVTPDNISPPFIYDISLKGLSPPVIWVDNPINFNIAIKAITGSGLLNFDALTDKVWGGGNHAGARGELVEFLMETNPNLFDDYKDGMRIVMMAGVTEGFLRNGKVYTRKETDALFNYSTSEEASAQNI